MLQSRTLDISAHPSFDGHEQVVHFQDDSTGLDAIIAIHNTNLGPSLGGARFFPYAEFSEALTDVLRLSRGMTYKSALAQLPLGGGKAVIIGDPRKIKTEALMESFGAAVEQLKGRYITAEDVGTTELDMIAISRRTKHVTGLPPLAEGTAGVSGNPSPVTALGCFYGIKACAKERYGSADLTGRIVAIQGLGAVGYALAEYLIEAGARLIAADVHHDVLDRAKKQFGEKIQLVEPSAILSVKADILSPCALGAILNDRTLPGLQVDIIAGPANNQLAEKKHDAMLKDMNILYAPDYAINSGGVTSVGYEYYWRIGKNPFDHPLDMECMIDHVKKIEDVLLNIFSISRLRNIPTGEAADRLAEDNFREKPLKFQSESLSFKPDGVPLRNEEDYSSRLL
jgi:leucine dehydrogenase